MLVVGRRVELTVVVAVVVEVLKFAGFTEIVGAGAMLVKVVVVLLLVVVAVLVVVCSVLVAAVILPITEVI